MTDNLTNAELQAAINATSSHRSWGEKEHHTALLAVQLARLQPSAVECETLTDDVTPLVHNNSQWETVLAWFRAGKVHASQCTPKYILEQGYTKYQTYGLYTRLIDSGEPWRLVTNSLGGMPETVEEIS